MAQLKNSGKIASLVLSLVRDPIEEMGYALWDVDYYKEGADHTLLITIENRDRAIPLGIEDCEKVSRVVSPLLDREDPIDESYCLEVSSPGVERELKKEEHFSAYLGEPIALRLYQARDGQKELKGTLQASDSDSVTLEIAGDSVTISAKEIAKAYVLDADFS